MGGFTEGKGEKWETNSGCEIKFWWTGKLEVRRLPHDLLVPFGHTYCLLLRNRFCFYKQQELES